MNGILNGLIKKGTTGERHVQGEWIFAWVLEGTAIQDVFICPSRKARIKDYQTDAAYATAVRMYNPNTEAWDILYTELEGLQLEGKREGNRIVQTEINEKNIQWVFSEITTTSFRWQRMVKRPDGTGKLKLNFLPSVDDYCRILRFVRKQNLIPFGNQDFTVFAFSSKWCHQESNNTIQSPNLQYFNIFENP